MNNFERSLRRELRVLARQMIARGVTYGDARKYLFDAFLEEGSKKAKSVHDLAQIIGMSHTWIYKHATGFSIKASKDTLTDRWVVNENTD